jgi:hypothetical protein
MVMNWTRKLPTPIALKNGRALATLADARELIAGFPERLRAKAHWQQATELLMKVADDRATGIDVARAADQLKIALKAEGLV